MNHYKNLKRDTLVDTFEGVLYTEEWMPVMGYEGLYSISSFGRLMAERKTVLAPERTGGKITRKEKMMKIGVSKSGYLKCVLLKEGKHGYFSMHRLVAIHYIENIENKPQVNHIEGDKKDNRFFRLEWASASENLIHAYKKGLQRQDGEHHATKKLNWEKVREIRSLSSNGIDAHKLGEMYGVHFGHIKNIIANLYWKENK